MSEIVNVQAAKPKRVFGRLKGQIRIMPGFQDLDSEAERDFEESIVKPLEP